MKVVLIYLWGNEYSRIVHTYYGCLLSFLVNLKIFFSYNKCQNHFLYGILKIKHLYFSSSSKTVQKMEGTTDILEGTNILKSYTYIFVLCKFFWKITDCNWMINVKNLFYVWDLENYSVEHKQCLSNCAEISRGTKISGRTNILRTSGYWFPTGFFRKRNTASALEVPKSALCVGSWKLNTFT